jgi:hypothetical protein
MSSSATMVSAEVMVIEMGTTGSAFSGMISSQASASSGSISARVGSVARMAHAFAGSSA